MLVKLGPLIAEARGSIGGATAARNRYGAYFRNRTKPVDPSSAKQNTQRTHCASAVSAWRSLTAAGRDLWNAKSLVTDFTNRIGESFHPSGMNLFIRSDMLLTACGREGVSIPPVIPVIDDRGTRITYTVDPGLDVLTTIADWDLDMTLLVWEQKDCSNSKYFFKGPYSIQRVLGNANFIGGSFTIEVDGDLQADSSMFCKWRLVDNLGGASAIRYGRAYKPPAA